MIRTKELDKHWAGMWWCTTCAFYTGQPDLHKEHELVRLTNCPLDLFVCKLYESA